jgi:hypothetical protein
MDNTLPLQISVKNIFIRGSVVRYVQLPAGKVDTQLLQVWRAFRVGDTIPTAVSLLLHYIASVWLAVVSRRALHGSCRLLQDGTRREALEKSRAAKAGAS